MIGDDLLDLTDIEKHNMTEIELEKYCELFIDFINKKNISIWNLCENPSNDAIYIIEQI